MLTIIIMVPAVASVPSGATVSRRDSAPATPMNMTERPSTFISAPRSSSLIRLPNNTPINAPAITAPTLTSVPRNGMTVYSFGFSASVFS